jgi:GT2 family glycosyltransferase
LSSDVLAVILNWNCAPDTIRCLRAVAAGVPAPEIVVVDNGSVDDSVARLKDEPVTLLSLGDNLGYAGGMNAGIRAAYARGARWVWLLNADAVPRPGALAALLRVADRYAVAGSRQVTSADPGDPHPSAYTVAAVLPKGKVRPFGCPGCPAGVHDVDVVTGASLLLDVGRAVDVGLFDERFFHYKEEFDLARRLGSVGYVCASEVWHARGGSLPRSSPAARYYHHRNEVLYVRKHHRHPVRRLLAEPVHYRAVATAVLRLAFGSAAQRAGSRAVLAGYRDGLRGVHGRATRY